MGEPLPEDIDDGERYVPLPHKNDLGLGKPLILRFTNEFLPESEPGTESGERVPGVQVKVIKCHISYVEKYRSRH